MEEGGGVLLRWLRWQCGSRILPGPVVISLVDDLQMVVRPGMTGATGNLYCGLHEYEDMAFLLHGLKQGDHFMDVGANVGSYTLLAVAAGATVDAMEPVPETFAHLATNVRLNDLARRVTLQRVAAGWERGTVRFTANLDTTNHVLGSEEYGESAIEVPIVSLDEVLEGRVPTLLKIDVEGVETEVIAGAERTLQHPNLLAVIMELNGSGKWYGYDERALHRQMLDRGFEPHRYHPATRELSGSREDRGTTGNCLYLREASEWVRRVNKGRTFQLGTGAVV